MYVGIDYGQGITNIDLTTRIRFGVISLHDVCQAWCDSSKPVYDEDDEELDECAFAEPQGYMYTDEGYFATTDFDSCDIFIERSPYYTYAMFCSPCAPGACHLRSPLKIEPAMPMNNRCYCFGHDWFDEGKAPYRIFSVATNQEVFPAGSEA